LKHLILEPPLGVDQRRPAVALLAAADQTTSTGMGWPVVEEKNDSALTSFEKAR